MRNHHNDISILWGSLQAACQTSHLRYLAAQENATNTVFIEERNWARVVVGDVWQFVICIRVWPVTVRRAAHLGKITWQRLWSPYVPISPLLCVHTFSRLWVGLHFFFLIKCFKRFSNMKAPNLLLSHHFINLLPSGLHMFRPFPSTNT